MLEIALTLDGRVLQLGGGSAEFSYQKELSVGHQDKQAAKDKVRTFRWFDRLNSPKAAHLACSVDAGGVVHDAEAVAPPSPDDKAGAAARLRLFHSKRKFRRQESDEVSKPSVLRADDSGMVEPLPETGHRFERQHSIDSDGIVHDMEGLSIVHHEDAAGHVDRLKRFYRKRVQRNSGNWARTGVGGGLVVSVDDMGLVRDTWEQQDNVLIVPSTIEAY